MSRIWELYENLDGYSYASNLETDELVYMNKKLRDLCGIKSPSEVCGKCYKVLSGFDEPCDFCNNSRLKEGEYIQWETINNHLNKVVNMVDTVVIEDGIRYRLSLGIDATEAKEKEKSKTLELNDYKTILDSMRSTGIYVITEDEHRVLYYNDKVKQVAPNMALGSICHEIWSGTCDNCPLLSIGEHVTQTTINYDDPFGEIVDITASRTLWKDEIPAYIVQVSPHVETETEHSAKIRGLYIETMQDVFFRSALVDMETGHYELYNIGGEKTDSHYPEVYNKLMEHQTQYIEPKYQEEYEELCNIDSLTKYFSEGNQSFEYVYEVVGIKNIKWVRFVARLCKSNPKQMIVMLEDFTKQKEQELKNAQKLKAALEIAEYASRAKTDFLSRMSHDLRTPMNGIIGLTDIVYDSLEDMDIATVKGHLKKIKMAGKQLESIINDVLDMSRLESGRMQLNYGVCNLIDGIHAITPGIEMLAKENAVRLVESHDDLKHENVISSPMHLQRILTNILSNAIKYNRPNGTLEVWSIEEPIDESHSNFTFKIKDTGIGMSKEFQKKLFEPFEREHSEEEYQGTGLGMTITKEMVEMMGGTIDVQSELNVGTTVTINIPMEVVDSEGVDNQNPEDEMDQSIDGMRILVVEDNDMNMEIARFVLEDAGATVTSAVNGQEAVDLFEQNPDGTFDLIVMDIRMPVMNGLEATRIIRQSSKATAKTIPIIAATANAFAEDVAECMEAGMNGHIAKPIDIHKLVGQIKSICK